MTDRPENAASSFELLLQGKLEHFEDVQVDEPLRAGMICPKCKLGKLAYNGLLALECPNCGYTSGEGGGCT